MTTITRLKQLREQVAGKLNPQRVTRKPIPKKPTEPLLIQMIQLDRFASFREKIVPTLRENGYGYFLSCDTPDYMEHQKWCDEHCQETTLPFCDVWQIASHYPRAFASRSDAAMFKLTFDATSIDTPESN